MTTVACGSGSRSINPAQQPLELLMLGIAAIAIFLVVIALLNRYEFGRFD